MADQISLDTETLAILARFNDGLERIDAADRRERAVKAAEKTKEEAAAKLRAIEADGKADAEARSVAQDEYRKAVESWQETKRRAEAGEDVADPAPEASDDADTHDDTDAAADSGADVDPADHVDPVDSGADPDEGASADTGSDIAPPAEPADEIVTDEPEASDDEAKPAES